MCVYVNAGFCVKYACSYFNDVNEKIYFQISSKKSNIYQ